VRSDEETSPGRCGGASAPQAVGEDPATTGNRTIYLKSIDVFGFKTFAERTRLVFEPGIAAIVGPNGSGKSNFVDAVRWVLGEQSAKQLRGARMDEVIFAGNNHRRPLGLAEVTLTFENADGTLPTPYAEIAVTRRVYRTGESEYFLNKTQVRLRDIMDLLLGTGLGPDASAIVSQGQIDAILSAKPEQRRELFEEAAGTSKYQARKREAQRRLEQTEANALRVNDVLTEIEAQIPAIETQVRRAKRYRKATQALRDLEILSFVRKSAARRGERASLVETLGVDEADAGGAGADRERLAADANRARYDEYQATMALDARTASRAEAAQRVQDAATAHATAAARSDEADRRCIDLARELREAALAVDEAVARIDVQSRELAATRQRRDQALAAGEGAAADERAGSLAWEAAYADLRALEDRRATAAADAAESDSAAHAAASERERLSAQEKRIADESDAGATRLAGQRSGETTLRAQVAELAGAVEHLAAEAAQAVAERDARATEFERRRAALDEARARVVETKARVDALREVDVTGIGVPAGVKALVGRNAEAGLRGIIGVVADLIEVDGAYATAIDVALGSRVHDVVTEGTTAAKDAIELLKHTRAGRATLLPMDVVRQCALPFAGEIKGGEGYVGRAVDLVRCAPQIRPVVDHLLHGVFVVKTLAAALDRMPAAPPVTLVTLDGEVVRNAAITGGSGDGETGPLARRAQIAELAREVDIAAAAAAGASQVHEVARAAHAAAVEAVDQIARRHVEAQMRWRDGDGALERARSDIDALEKRHADLQAQAHHARSEFDRACADALRYAVGAESARQAAATLEAERLEAADRADRLHAALTDFRDRHRTAAAEAAALVERVAQASDDVEAARAAHASCVKAHEAKKAAHEEAHARRDEIRSETAELAQAKSESDAALLGEQAQLDGLRAKRDELAALARGLEEALAAAQARERERSMELERKRIRLAEIDAELSVLQETFAQNPATDEECRSVAARYERFVGEADPEIRRLRDECARLGNVNLNALEDQTALLDRREFLRKQLSDLEGARASILSVIAEIDAESLRQFNATFELIAQAFSETFVQLFSGGVGKIWLGESTDPTEAGIEIAVQPPGKKMQSLNLLSGGERAMTAVALIFAILKVRPSPFYIFDEIDAALDEANIGRFGAMLRGIADRAQTIIITHNKATMTLADRIYGVTMGEPGVSNILSLALEQVSA
jgi:chromosome segregation protein